MKRYLIFATAIFLLAAGCNKAVKNNQNNQNQDNQQNQQSTNDNLSQGEKNGWNTYTSPAKYGFSIQYHPYYGFSTSYDQVKALGYIPVCDEDMLVCVYFDQKIMPNYKGTNFEGAGVSVNILNNLTTADKCQTMEGAQGVKTTVNAETFYRFGNSGQGAAGHFEEFQSNRIFKNNQCYEVMLRLTSSDIGVYEPGTVKEFNKNEIWNSLEQIFSTFKFNPDLEANIDVYEYDGIVLYLKRKDDASFSGEVHIVRKDGKDSVIIPSVNFDQVGGEYPRFYGTSNPNIVLLSMKTGDLAGYYEEHHLINLQTREVTTFTLKTDEIFTLIKTGAGTIIIKPVYSDSCGNNTIKKPGDKVTLNGISVNGINAFKFSPSISMQCQDPGGIGSWYDPSLSVHLVGVDKTLTKFYLKYLFYHQDGSENNLTSSRQVYYDTRTKTINEGSPQDLLTNLGEI